MYLFPLDKVPDELGHPWTGQIDSLRLHFTIMALLSYGQGDLHDKGGNSFKHDSHYRQQGWHTHSRGHTSTVGVRS